MRRALPLAGLLLAWTLMLGAPSCPPPAPQPTPTPCVTCPAGQHCEGGACVADPPPPTPDPSPICEPGATCGCWHRPPGEEWQQLPPCTPECPAAPSCPAGEHAEVQSPGNPCTVYTGRCVADAPEPTVCTIPLNGTPVLGAYWHQDRVVDFTPKITNPTRCNLPEVGYPGRQTCPACDEGCLQRGVCETALMGGPAPKWACDSPTLRCYDDDGWKVRVAGVGTGTMLACYPNRAACVTLQMTCGAGGCRK